MVKFRAKLLCLSVGLFYCLLLCQGQKLKECQEDSECLPVASCPKILALARTRTPEDRRLVRKAICGFKRSSLLVCCDPCQTLKSAKDLTPPEAGNESLLPRLCGRPAQEDKIIEGTETPLGAYPWVAAFGYTAPGSSDVGFECSGSIINSKYVLTAAHCLDPAELGIKRLSVIRLGDWDLSTDPDCARSRAGNKCYGPHIAAGYEEIVMHPQYNKRAKSSDDIALVRLNVTLNFDEDAAMVEPICLPEKTLDARTFAGLRQPIAVGWGFTEHGSLSDILLSVNIPIINDRECKDLYPQFIGNQLCVGGQGKQDTCNGDSGGPLILPEPRGPPFTQIGIVSYGVFPCGMESFPGVYTAVADYKTWIVENLRP